MVINGYYRPLQAMIMPTNKCNLNCSFCCCDDRNINEELTFDDLTRLLHDLQSVGTKAITLTGGGDPTMHRDFEKIVLTARNMGFKIGLVTNGIKLKMFTEFPKDTFEWIRVSMGDGRNLENSIDILKNVNNWYENGIVGYTGVSYVLTENPNKEVISCIANLVDSTNISYLKFIIDENICQKYTYEDLLPDVKSKKKIITPIYFESVNNEPCMLHWLKPIFAPDGFVYPCCEVQYNNDDKTKQYRKDKKICNFDDYFKFINNKEKIPIMSCKKCFHTTMIRYLYSTYDNYIHSDWI